MQSEEIPKEIYKSFNSLQNLIKDLSINTKTNLVNLLKCSKSIANYNQSISESIEFSTKDLVSILNTFINDSKKIFKEIRCSLNIVNESFLNKTRNSVFPSERVSAKILDKNSDLTESRNNINNISTITPRERAYSTRNVRNNYDNIDKQNTDIAKDVINFIDLMDNLQESILNKGKNVKEKKKSFEKSKRNIFDKAKSILRISHSQSNYHKTSTNNNNNQSTNKRHTTRGYYSVQQTISNDYDFENKCSQTLKVPSQKKVICYIKKTIPNTTAYSKEKERISEKERGYKDYEEEFDFESLRKKKPINEKLSSLEKVHYNNIYSSINFVGENSKNSFLNQNRNRNLNQEFLHQHKNSRIKSFSGAITLGQKGDC